MPPSPMSSMSSYVPRTAPTRTVIRECDYNACGTSGNLPDASHGGPERDYNAHETSGKCGGYGVPMRRMLIAVAVCLAASAAPDARQCMFRAADGRAPAV